MNEHYEKIWQKIADIPKGSVATYGQIAKMVGLPRHARMVGYALRQSPDSLNLPWHRVINSKGESAFPQDSESYRTQQTRLRAEGVPMIGGKVSLSKYRWEESMDELLWKP
ncbi:MAG: methylated-DNA--[protein]-cysteine S-methyltransferase [Pseudomonadota bacterium]